MTVDPRVQKFYDEATAAKKELRRLAVEIAARRIDRADIPSFPPPRPPIAMSVVPEMTWSLENGRTDLAARILELVDQYNNSMGTAVMMERRVQDEAQERIFLESRAGCEDPAYLEEDEGDGEPIRMSGEEAAQLFSSFSQKP